MIPSAEIYEVVGYLQAIEEYSDLESDEFEEEMEKAINGAESAMQLLKDNGE